MAQYEMNLRDYWFIIRRRRLIISLSTILTALFSLWWAQQKVPVYTATAAVKYEQSTAVAGLLVGALSYSSADSIETQVSLIKSTPILEEVARQMGKMPEPVQGRPLRESKAYWNAIDSISGKVRISRVPSTSILEITATSTDPLEATQLANTVAQVYRKYSRETRNQSITDTRKFIEAQLKELEGRVKRSEEEVWAFREANRIIAPGAESQLLMSMLTQVRGDIEKTRQQRIELEGAQARLARPASATAEPVFIDSANPLIQKLQQSQNELLMERTTLSLEYTDKHPKLQAIDDRLLEIRAEIRRQIAAQLTLLRGREETLNRQFTELLQKNQEIPTLELGLQQRQRNAKENEDQLALLKAKHQEALIKESEAVEEVAIVRPANEPDAPTRSERLNTIIVGGILGMMLGLVLAFVQETLDTSIGTIEDVESYLEVPVLGVVPHIDARETTQRLIEKRPALAQMDPESLRNHALLITHFDPKSPVAEAYRTLRTNIQFARLERAGKILVVTSPTLQEGKTTTIVNLALTMAQNGQKTLLLGSNLRRPSIYRFFGIEREPGLSDILVGSVNWRDCIRTVADILMGRFEMEDIMAAPGLDNLHIIEAGPIPANPSELLSTKAMHDFLAAIRNEYDIVLIDTPPVLPVTDAAIVASQADGVVLVYQAGKVGRLVLKRAKVHLEGVGGKVWGVVLNDVHTEISGYQYTHYYTHYYGEETPPETTTAGRIGTWVGGLRTQFSRRGTADDAADASTVLDAPPLDAADTDDIGTEPERKRKTRRSPKLWLGIVLALTGIGVGAVVIEQFGWPGRRVEPKVLLRQKREALPPSAPIPPPAPPTPAPSAAPADTMADPPSSSAPSTLPPPASPSRTSSAIERIVAPTTPIPPPVPTNTTAKLPAATGRTSGVVAATPASPANAAAARFAVELGPFLSVADTERIEKQLNQAGYQTVRVRQRNGGALYAVTIERIPSVRDAQSLIAALRDKGFADATVVGTTEPVTVRVGEPRPLRMAVEVAERLRGDGHNVRLAASPGDATMFVVRHGSFASRGDAEAKSDDLVRLGLPNQVVQVQ